VDLRRGGAGASAGRIEDAAPLLAKARERSRLYVEPRA